ncbi:MAG: ADOP family duplicated permease [Acidobacteriota bacterium]
MLDSLRHDLRFALRAVRRRPRLLLLGVLTLSSGLGLYLAVASLADTVLLRPLEVDEPDRLVTVGNVWRGLGYGLGDQFLGPLSIPEVLDQRAHDELYAEIAGYRVRGTAVTIGRGGPEHVEALETMPELSSVLRLRPALGRLLESADAQADAAAVAVIGHGLWQRRFGGVDDVLGRHLEIGGTRHEIVGVLPAGLDLPEPGIDLWWPIRDPASQPRGWRSGGTIARLAPGVELAAVRAALPTIEDEIRYRDTDYSEEQFGWGLGVRGLQDALTHRARPALLLLLAASALVVLVAAANLANLILATTLTRQRELSVRSALGAGSRRLTRQLFLECGVLCVVGGVGGLVLAELGRRLLSASQLVDMPRLADWALGARTVLHAGLVCVALAAALTLVLGPLARRLMRRDALRSRTGGTGSPRLRAALVVAEVALAVALVAGAGLLLRSLDHLLDVDPRFRSEGAAAARVDLQPPHYADAAARHRFADRLLQALRDDPTIESAGTLSLLPLEGTSDRSLHVEGSSAGGTEQIFTEQYRTAGEGVFRALGQPLVAGREFAHHDTADSAPVAVVDSAFARKFFGSAESAVGRRLRLPGEERSWRTIVGVVAAAPSYALEMPPQPTYYLPSTQISDNLALVVRSRIGASAALDALRRELAALDPELPLYDALALDELVHGATAEPRLQGLLVGVFAVVATLLAALGVYGVLAALVEEQRPAIGVRMAIGADRSDILGQILRRALRLGGAGVGLGLLLALSLGGALERFLFGVRPHDPAVLGAVALGVLAVSLLAAWLPAQRAAGVDPIDALRAD